MTHDFMTHDFWLISHDSLLMLIVAVAPDHGNNSWWEWVVGPESVEKSWKSWQLAENRNFSFFSVLGRFSTFSTFVNGFRSAYSFPPTIVLITLHDDHYKISHFTKMHFFIFHDFIFLVPLINNFFSCQSHDLKIDRHGLMVCEPMPIDFRVMTPSGKKVIDQRHKPDFCPHFDQKKFGPFFHHFIVADD